MKAAVILLLTAAEFRAQFRPIVNLVRDDAAQGGTLYDTVGLELAHVVTTQAVNPGYVWSVRQDGGRLLAERGYNRAGAIGFFITEKKADGPALVVLEENVVLPVAV